MIKTAGKDTFKTFSWIVTFQIVAISMQLYKLEKQQKQCHLSPSSCVGNTGSSLIFYFTSFLGVIF